MAEIDQPRPASAWTSTSSPCVSIGRGLSAAAGLEHRQQRVGPRPIRWTRPSGWPDPGAQTWGDSVISSGEIPLIRDTVRASREGGDVRRLHGQDLHHEPVVGVPNVALAARCLLYT